MARKLAVMMAVAMTGSATAAHADLVPAQAFAMADATIPAAYSMLLWAPLLALAFGCVAALLWLIRSDADKAVRSGYRRARHSLLPAAKKSMTA